MNNNDNDNNTDCTRCVLESHREEYNKEKTMLALGDEPTKLHLLEVLKVINNIFLNDSSLNNVNVNVIGTLLTSPRNKNPLFYLGTSTRVTRKILQMNINVNHECSKGRNALFYASNEEVVDMLLDAGININHLDKDGNNALFYNKHTHIKKHLIKRGIDIFHINNHDETVLFYKCSGLLEYYIEQGIEVNHVSKVTGKTCLHSMNSDKDCFERVPILLKNGYDITQLDYENRSFLFYYDLPIIILLHSGLDNLNLNQRDIYGETILYKQCMSLNMSLLLKHGLKLSILKDIEFILDKKATYILLQNDDIYEALEHKIYSLEEVVSFSKDNGILFFLEGELLRLVLRMIVPSYSLEGIERIEDIPDDLALVLFKTKTTRLKFIEAKRDISDTLLNLFTV